MTLVDADNIADEVIMVDEGSMQGGVDWSNEGCDDGAVTIRSVGGRLRIETTMQCKEAEMREGLIQPSVNGRASKLGATICRSPQSMKASAKARTCRTSVDSSRLQPMCSFQPGRNEGEGSAETLGTGKR